jgi:hypothetical protein
MHILRIALTCGIILFSKNSFSDATSDLFAGIQEQNIQKVSTALAAGADTDSKRGPDGMNAKSFAAEELKRICHTPMPLFGSLFSSCTLAIASWMYDKKYAFAGISAVLAGIGLSFYKQHDLEEKPSTSQKLINTYNIDNLVGYAGTATLLASAWASKRYLLSSIGTAGLLSWYYQAHKIRTACQIYVMVDPEHELVPEIA